MRATATVTVLLLLGAGAALGHGGGLDANGCHTNRKTGEYHCHRVPAAAPAPAAPSSRSSAAPIIIPSAKSSSAQAISSVRGAGAIEVVGGSGAATQRELTLAAQALLKVLGYYQGAVDGVPLGATATAVYRFQGDVGITQEGRVNGPLLVALSRQVLAKGCG